MSETVQALPRAMEVWIHRSGRAYTVDCVTNTAATDHEKFPVTVVYHDRDGNTWSRPVHQFTRKFQKECRVKR